MIENIKVALGLQGYYTPFEYAVYDKMFDYVKENIIGFGWSNLFRGRVGYAQKEIVEDQLKDATKEKSTKTR